MKRLILISVLFVAFSFIGFGQKVIVFDYQTGKPVANVLVFNKNKTVSTITDLQGAFQANEFKNHDTIIFRHSAYKTKELTCDSLESKGYKIFLEEKLFNLKEVVVSANKWEEDKNEIPNEIDLISRKEVVLNNPATTADMLQQGGEVFVQKSQLGGGSPMIRGFAANRILFVIDGVRMNNAIYRSGNLQNILQADVNSIESAEVIFGPGTNIYGSDALGGVMDFHILRPEMNTENNWQTNGTVMMRFSSAAKEKTGHLKLNIANNKWGFLTLATFTDFDDLRMGSNGDDFYLRNEYVKTFNGKDTIVKNDNPLIQRYSGYSQINFVQKINYNIDNKSEFFVNFYLTATSNVPRYDRLLQYKKGKLKYSQWYYKPQQWIMASTGYNNHNNGKFSDSFKVILAYQNVIEGRNDRKYKNEWLRDRKEKVNILSLNMDAEKELENKQTLFYGLELVFNNVQSIGLEKNIITSEENIIPSRYPDRGTDVFNGGAYFTYKNNFCNSLFTFQSGLRLSYAFLNSDFVDTSWYHLPFTNINMSNGAITGSAGIIYHPESWRVSFNFSSGFRAPNLDDVAKVFDSEPGNVVVPNENLKPEYLYNGEVSVEKTFGDFFRISVTAFYSYLNNAMVRGDYTVNGQDSIMYDGEMSKVQAVVNAGYANIYGVNGELFARIVKSLGVKVKANYIKGYDDNNNPLRHVSPFFGGASLLYDNKKLQLEFYALYNGKIKYENLAHSERKKDYLYVKDGNGNPYSPSWVTLNLKGSFAFNRHLLLTAGIENILDKRYRPYSSGITAPGVNFIVALNLSF